jgi:hypothetical protein
VDSLSQIERRFYDYLQRLLPHKDEDLTLLHQRLVAIVQRHQLIRREFGFSVEADHDSVHLDHVPFQPEVNYDGETPYDENQQTQHHDYNNSYPDDGNFNHSNYNQQYSNSTPYQGILISFFLIDVIFTFLTF